VTHPPEDDRVFQPVEWGLFPQGSRKLGYAFFFGLADVVGVPFAGFPVTFFLPPKTRPPFFQFPD